MLFSREGKRWWCHVTKQFSSYLRLTSFMANMNHTHTHKINKVSRHDSTNPEILLLGQGVSLSCAPSSLCKRKWNLIFHSVSVAPGALKQNISVENLNGPLLLGKKMWVLRCRPTFNSTRTIALFAFRSFATHRTI